VLGVLLTVAVLRPATVPIWATEAKAAPEQPLTLPQPAADGEPSAAAWTPILEDAYDGTYETTYSIPRVIAATGLPFQWGRVTRQANAFYNTLWCVQGWSGGSLIAGRDNYGDGVDTTVTYGPIDLRNAKTVQLSFRHWISVAQGDGLSWAVSVASAPVNYTPVTPAVQGAWESTTLHSATTPALAALLGQDAVYLSFRFRSNSDGQVDKGVFLDDVKLWGNIYSWAYLPLAMKVKAMGYSDDFSDINSGFPIQWEWIQKKPTEEIMWGGYMLARPAEQVWADLLADRTAEDMDPLLGDRWALDPTGLELQAERARFLAEDQEVYYTTINDDWDIAFIGGPFQADGDFDVEVRGRINYVAKWFQGNRYGILLTKEPVVPWDPHTIHGYSFQLEINPNSGGTTFDEPWWRFKEWYRTDWDGDDCSKSPCDEERTAGDDPSWAIHSTLGKWNTLRIERRGKDFILYINGTYIRTLEDEENNVGPFYVGLIGQHMGSSLGEIAYDVQFEWDDLVVTLR